jgi:hypothetical protein
MAQEAFVPAPPLTIEIENGARAVDITFEQLRETRTFADAWGVMPKQHPLEHHVFIQKLIDMATEVNSEPTIDIISASVKHIERISETEAVSKGLNQEEAQNTTIKALIGKINLGNKFAKELWNLAIGFMYNEKGIEVCLGVNIAICSNLTLWGDGVHLKNYGRDGIEMSEMFKKIEDWYSDLDFFDSEYAKLLERMAAVKIDWAEDSNKFLGQCLREAVRKNYHKGEDFPLNVGQVSKIASYIIDHENEYLIDDATLYHLYNAATYVITHQDGIMGKFSDAKAFTEWFEQYWLTPMEPDPNDLPQ